MNIHKVFLFFVFVFSLFSLSYGGILYEQSTDYATKVTNGACIVGTCSTAFSSVTGTGFSRTWSSGSESIGAYITFSRDVKVSRTNPINITFDIIESGTRTGMFVINNLITNSSLGNNDGYGWYGSMESSPNLMLFTRYDNSALSSAQVYNTGSNTYFETSRKITITFNGTHQKMYINGVLTYTNTTMITGGYNSFRYYNIAVRQQASSTVSINNLLIKDVSQSPSISSIKTQFGTLTNNSYFNSTTLRFNVTTSQPTQKKYFLYNYSLFRSNVLEQQTQKTSASAGIYTTNWKGQTFKPNFKANTFYNISNIVLSLRKQGSPTGTVNLIVKEWTGTTFTGSNVCSTTFSSSGLSSSQTDYNYSISCLNLNASKTYGFYLNCITSCDASNYVVAYGKSTGDVYPYGYWTESANSGSTWTPSVADDFYFILNIKNAQYNAYNLKSSGLLSPTGTNALSSFVNLTPSGSLNNLWRLFFNATNVNGTTTSSNYTFTIDTTKPFIDFSKISATYNTPSPPRLNITIIDTNPNTCKYKLDSGAYASCTNSTFNTFIPGSLSIGNHTLYVNATDRAGNYNISSKTFNYNPRRIVFTFLNVLNNNSVTGVAFRDRNFSTNYNTGVWNNLTLYHNAGTYKYNLSKTGYQKINSTYTISATDVITYKTVYLSPVFNITLYDEVSLKLFNFTGTSSVYLRVTCSNESVQQYLLTKNNFGINISCFYTEFKFVVNYPSTSYYRSILLDVQNTKFDVYLMNLITTQSVFVSFQTFDLIGEYVNPKIVLTKSIGSSQAQITGDFVDASGNVPAYLVLGDKYSLVLYSDNLPTKQLGFFTAATGGEVSLILFTVAFKPQYYNKDYQIVHQEYLSMVGTTNFLIVQYNDTGANTNSVNLVVRRSNEFGTIIYSDTTALDLKTWMLNLTPFNITGNVYVKVTANTGYQTAPLYFMKLLRVNGGTVDLGISNFTFINLDWVITLILSFITLIFTYRTASMGSVVLVGLAALCMTFDWLQLSWAFLTLAIVVMFVGVWFGVNRGDN